MQKPISDKIQIGQTLNSARDYGGVSSIKGEGKLENIISKVDKSTNVIKQVMQIKIYLGITQISYL